jgi:hypothetical protein
MNRIQHSGIFCKASHRCPNPGELLEERLALGLGAPDQELMRRAGECARWFSEQPWKRPRWIARLRASAENPLTAHLWPVVAPILTRPASA